ncbi:Uu.00g061640.m01.CDS01 [Anthostomella pinea]|uniref:Uu.00g061640.m01.CDS01 n=1 Tax=Anthostomella pinea TaxID=933095 RepID=A0AAI8YML3_9PEZI|nr:Uu.00g061640.m01.CDS01 [Anthostomella pinea]
MPIELDKPSTAPIDSNSPDEDVVQVQEGNDHGALLQDPKGNVIFPGYMPPDIESPNPPLTTTSSDTLPGSSKTSDPATGDQKSRSEPLNEPPTSLVKSPKKERPTFDKKFQTDAPRRNHRDASAFPSAPSFRRAGTNLSMQQTALWRQQEQADESSSSSSDDDEQNGPASQHGRSKRQMAQEQYRRRFQVENDNYHTKGKVSKRDGRLNITVNDTSNTGYLAKALGTAVKKVVIGPGEGGKITQRSAQSRLSSATTATSKASRRPKLNIVIMVIGSRGDAQPFLKIGKLLKEEYGHRVRIATHPAFRDFVERDSGLEFFSVGGDPSELMAFMVKNPGMIPKLETVKAGDIGRRRAAMAEMFEGFWRACVNATDNEKDAQNLKMMGKDDPFVADTIIANPPSFAHVHCAEALGIPLHLMFTFPYTPTQAFPHPLASINKSNVDPGYTNFISYPLVEMMVWQGLGDLVNDFRIKTLGLDPVSTLWAPGATYRLHVPFTYLWSPALVPKPEDWGPEVDISGFVFLDLASTFKPPVDLVKFLDAGEAPIYIGFGSIVVDDADRFTEMIFEAVRAAGVRALVSKGWGGLGQDNVPENIYMLENTPHDWLFPKVRACVIHGGAGTTAAALKCGKPTAIVPFFGDQNFWGSMVANAGAGPDPVPYKQLNAERLAESIKYCLTDEALEAAQEIARSIEAEGDGAKNAVRAFHRSLTLSGEKSMRCSILDDRVAVWTVKNTSLKLSALAADVAVDRGYISWRRLRLIRHKEWNDFEGPGEPITGIAGALMSTVGDLFGGIGGVPYHMTKTSNKRAERKKKKEERKTRRQKLLAERSAAKANGKYGPAANGANGGATPGSMADQPDNASLLAAGTPGTAPLEPAQDEYFHDVQEGVGRSGRALVRAPVDLTLAIAQGFHNAPRLYGDETVRRPTRVTGIKSGLRAAGSEFMYGIYDGVTGIVRLPYRGAKEDGVEGAVAGVGMGLMGFVLKDLAAIFAPVGYTLKGVAKEVSGGKKQVKYLRRARIIHGQRELKALSDSERKVALEDIEKGWRVMRQLADVIMSENGKRGLQGHLRRSIGKKGEKSKSLGKWGKGRAFENVEIAERAIEAINQGEKLDVVLGNNKPSTEEARKSMEKRVSHEMSRKSVQTGRQSEDTRSRDNFKADDFTDGHNTPKPNAADTKRAGTNGTTGWKKPSLSSDVAQRLPITTAAN